MDVLLEVKKVSVAFSKDRKILDEVSFEIKRGELISLIGLNGTGKTTLLKTIVGLIKPDSGKIIRHTGNIFYIPQKSDLDTSFPLTVEELCKLFAAKNYQQYLRQTGMDKFLRRLVGSLSSGEYQRVLIAIALSQQPDLLLLDEPTAGVDVAGEESFYQLISQIRHQHGIAILLVSHNIHLVIRNADKVLCLAGHLCCTGTPTEVAKNKEFQEIFGEYLEPYIHNHGHVH